MSSWEVSLFLAGSAVCLISGLLPLSTKESRIPRSLFFIQALLNAICLGLFPFYAKLELSEYLSRLLVISALILPGVWLTFSLSFARESYYTHLWRWKWWLSISAAVIGLFILVSFYNPLVVARIDASGNPELFVTGYGKWFIILLLLVSSFVLINTESTYRASTGIYRRKLRPSFVLIAAYFAVVIFSSSNAILKDYLTVGHVEILAGVSIVLFPVVGYYLRTYQLQKSGVYIRRQAVYSSVGIILIGLYLIIVGAVGKALQLIGADTRVFYSILAAFLVIVVFLSLLLSGSLKKRIRGFVDKSFYAGAPVDHQDDLAAFAEDISTTLDISQLVSKLSSLLREKLAIDRVWLYLEHGQLPYYTLVYPKTESRGWQIAKDGGFTDWIFRHGEAIEQDNLIARLSAANIEVPTEDLPETTESSVCIPLIAKHRMVGILIFERKAKSESFSHHDIQFVSAVGNQFALAALSARLSEDLLAARQIESFHKFSTYVVHDLKNSISMLSMLIQNFESNSDNPEFLKSAIVTVRGAVARMNGIISKLRAPDTSPERTLSDCNAADILVTLRNKLALDKLDRIEFTERIGTAPRIRANEEVLTGVVENLIVNAIEAMPQGGELTVALYEEDNCAVIEVGDTGIGMDQEFINGRLFKPFETTKKKGLGIGLYQARDQLERMGGRFSVSSRLGEGTTFKVLMTRS